MKRKIFISVMMMIPVLLLTFPFSVLAGTVGKISGKIINEETGEPLPGVAVSIVGTKIGALTNDNGEYFILNVPVGTYIVQASLIGFAPVEISNVSVSADLVSYHDFKLSKRALELGKTIMVTAERPLVMKDKTTTVNIVSGDDLRIMPVRGFEQVVGLQNSVVRMNSNVDIRQRGDRETSLAPEINLRGGRPSEVAYYVDGYSQQDPLSGISTANISNDAIQEVAVTSGAFSAEYGHVASGIVNVITNSGTDKYHAKVELVSDNIAQPLGYKSFDQNWYSADGSGPIPGLQGKGFFFLSGERRWLRDRTPSKVTKSQFQEFGVDKFYDLSEPQRLPNNSLNGWSYQGKLDFDLASNIKLALSGNGSLDKWQEYRHYYMNPRHTDEIKHLPRYEDKNLGLNAKITQTINPKTFYNLSASYFLTERTRGDGVLFDNLEAYPRPVANPRYDTYNLFREGRGIYASELDPSVVRGSDGDTIVTYYESYYANFMHRKSSYVGFKGDFNSQIGSDHTLKAGFDFQRHTLRYFENFDQTQPFNYTNVNRYGFDSLGNESDNQGFKNDTKHPINLGVYVQDRFEWSGLILNAGLRFDYFDYKALRLRSLSRPFDPDSVGSSTLDRSDLENSKKFTRLSPRLGISFPVSDKTQFYFNYGKYFQRPDLINLYSGYDFLAARITAGSYYPFPSPNLGPEKTTQYEFGLTHQLGDHVAVNVAAYYKDVEDLTQIFHQSPAFPHVYDFYANADFGTIKGVDISLTMKRTHNIALDLKYSLSYAAGTGSYSQSAFNIAWKNAQGGFAKQTSPLDYDQRHSIIGIIDIRTAKGEGPILGKTYILENMSLNTVIQASSGLPYTPMQIYDGVSPNASVQQIPRGPINSSNMPWQFSIDMKLERTFAFKNFQIVPYIWVKNLLNEENIVAVYEGTGEPSTSGYLESPEGQVRNQTSDGEFGYRYRFEENDPKNYLNPRMILCGLRLAF